MKTNKEKNDVALLREMFRLESVGDALRLISDSGTDAEPEILPFVTCAMGFDPRLSEDYWVDRFHEIQKMDTPWDQKAQQYYDDLKKWAIKENAYLPKRIIKNSIADELLHHMLTVPLWNHVKGFTPDSDKVRFEYNYYGCGVAFECMGFPMDGEFDSDEEIVGILDGIFKNYVASKTMEDVNNIGGAYECAEKIYNEWMAAIEEFEWKENKELETA